jgi:DNA-directed RNA polymerase I subunit RPA2
MQLMRECVFLHLDSPLDKLNLLLAMLQKLYALVGGQCSEDNPDALTHHEIMLPGQLLCKFLLDKLAESLEIFKAQVGGTRTLARQMVLNRCQ